MFTYGHKDAIIDVLDFDIDGYSIRSEIRGIDAETGEVLLFLVSEWGITGKTDRDSLINVMESFLRSRGYNARYFNGGETILRRVKLNERQ